MNPFARRTGIYMTDDYGNGGRVTRPGFRFTDRPRHPLNAARGIVLSCVAGLGIWGLIGYAVYVRFFA